MVTLNEIQEYVSKNHIKNKSSMRAKYKRALRVLEKNDPSINIKFDSLLVESSGEDFVIRKLIFYSIKNIKTGLIFPELIKNTRPCRFDILLIDYNLIIEVNGKQHFGSGEGASYYWKDVDRNQQSIDKMKKDFAENLGFKVVYFSLYKKEYEKFGYFDKVYFDIESLLIDNNIPLHINEDFEKSLEEFSITQIKHKSRDEVKNRIQSYINLNKISSPTELKRKKSVLLNLIYEYDLRTEVEFIRDKYDSAKINSISDINEILKKENILTLTLFKTKLVSLYSKFSHNVITEKRPDGKWKSKDLYFNNTDNITLDVINKFLISEKIINLDFLKKNYRSVYDLLKKKLKFNEIDLKFWEESKKI